MDMSNEPLVTGCLVIYSDRAAGPNIAGTAETTVRHKSAKRAYAEQVPVGPEAMQPLQTTPSKREILNCVLSVCKEWPHDVVQAVIF
jgi:hypothetical protein